MWNVWIIVKSCSLMDWNCNVRTCCSLQIFKYADGTTVFSRCFPGSTIFIFVQKWISSWIIVCSTFCGIWIKNQSLDNSINQEWLRQCESFYVWKWKNFNTNIRIHSPFFRELKTLRGIFHGINKLLNIKILFLDKNSTIKIHQNDHTLRYEHTWVW